VQLEHSFTVPVDIDTAWRILLDIERIGPCLPGAAIESVDGDDFTGTVKVKLGPINLTYKGKASFVEKDEGTHRAVIDARGRDARGNGTAAARVTATLRADGQSTTVTVDTDLDVTGKPAQFGRGVMVDVGNKLIGQFATALAATIGAGDGAPTPSAAPVAPAPAAVAAEPAVPDPVPAERAVAESPGTGEPEPLTRPFAGPDAAESVASVNGHPAVDQLAPRGEVEPINLLESAGPAVAKRLAPVAVAAVVVLLAVRRRHSRRG
jgi:uncharacterized protein